MKSSNYARKCIFFATIELYWLLCTIPHSVLSICLNKIPVRAVPLSNHILYDTMMFESIHPLPWAFSVIKTESSVL
jgi:hypothetical protein